MICNSCGAEYEGNGKCPVCGSEAGEVFGVEFENNNYAEQRTSTSQGTTGGRTRYCSHCGHRVHENAVVCVNCGCAIEGATSSIQTGEKSKTNGMAIAGFICSFLVPILGWVFGGIGLSKAGKMGGKGQNLSIAAIAIASANFVLGLILNYAMYL